MQICEVFWPVGGVDGHAGICALLLNKTGIDINAKNDIGDNALLLATDCTDDFPDPMTSWRLMAIPEIDGHKEIVEMLLAEPSIQPNFQDASNNTALMLAIYSRIHWVSWSPAF